MPFQAIYKLSIPFRYPAAQAMENEIERQQPGVFEAETEDCGQSAIEYGKFTGDSQHEDFFGY